MINNILLVASNSTLNSVITTYYIPFLVFADLMALTSGVIKNWSLINDTAGMGKRKEGFINLAWIAGYCIASNLLIAGVIAQVKSTQITI